MADYTCEYCGQPIADGAEKCPHCGAAAPGAAEKPAANKIPATIEELRAFCAAHRMPLEKMRFFIGEDYRGARAYGIYKDADGCCVVYKNKADGSRAVRYRGTDEKRAVRELYEKLKSETELRRGGSRPQARTVSRSAPYSAPEEPQRRGVADVLRGAWKPIVIALAIVVLFKWGTSGPSRGYYRYQNNAYYYRNNDWYFYNSGVSGWERAYDVPEALEENYGDYFESEYYDSAYAWDEFYYDSGGYDSWSSDWDSDYDDYDWDSDYDSWDSSDSDWDSDW